MVVADRWHCLEHEDCDFCEDCVIADVGSRATARAPPDVPATSVGVYALV